MNKLSFSLFGRFQISYDNKLVTSCDSQKAQELLCYLLLNRETPHTREKLATVFWENQSTSQAKKYLRQALWQLQTTFEKIDYPISQLLQIESDWIQINESECVCLDIAIIENSYRMVQDIVGRELTPEQCEMIQEATAVYHGKLLDGWYHGWCLYERERLHNFYLLLLDKLVAYCEYTQTCYEMGIRYGLEILRYDSAQERVHRRLMRLFYYSGNRTAALRQYSQCVDSLKSELDVSPSQKTDDLAEFIRKDLLTPSSHTQPLSAVEKVTPLLNQLQVLKINISHIQAQIEHDIEDFNALIWEK